MSYSIPSLTGGKVWIIETIPEVVARMGAVRLAVEGSGPAAAMRLAALAELHSLQAAEPLESECWDYGRSTGVSGVFMAVA